MSALERCYGPYMTGDILLYVRESRTGTQPGARKEHTDFCISCILFDNVDEEGKKNRTGGAWIVKKRGKGEDAKPMKRILRHTQMLTVSLLPSGTPEISRMQLSIALAHPE